MLIPNRFQPSFILFPLIDAKTAYQPVWLPTVLVVPWVRDLTGVQNDNSDIFNLIFRIENAPSKAAVAGHTYRGIFIPTFERFSIEIDISDRLNYKLDMSLQTFFDKDTGEEKTFDEAITGDTFTYTTVKGDLTDKITFYADADYYDLSQVQLETADLQPLGKYVLSWNVNYYRRVRSANDELFCIDATHEALARLAIVIDHPGEIHQALINVIPRMYFDDVEPDKDSTIAFLRPFANALNDVFDETGFIESINWIDRIPAQYLPYLAYLLGWDLPAFPGVNDNIKRRVLANARKLQELKGSKKCIQDLFDMFGFATTLTNLWYAKDGLSLIAPNEANNFITLTETCHSEPLVVDYNTNGFGDIIIPLLNRPKGNITIEAWLLNTSSSLYTELKDAVDLSSIDGTCTTNNDGSQINLGLHELLSSGPVSGYSRLLVSQKLGSTTHQGTGVAPLGQYGAVYDNYHNTINVVFGRNIEFESDEKLIIFATYTYDKVIVSDDFKDLQSNRFDIEILEKASGKHVDSLTLDFLLEFVFKLKAFHSLLRKIKFTLTNVDVYNVSNYCAGFDITQRPGTTAGDLQIPPPSTDEPVEGCVEQTSTLSTELKDLRAEILTGLENEFQAWKSLDDTHVVENRTTLDGLSNVDIPPDPTRTDCQFTERGQDKKETLDIDLDHTADTRETICGTPDKDYCYVGRVNGELEILNNLSLEDKKLCKICTLNFGIGYYFTINYKGPWCSTDGCISLDDKANINRSMLEKATVRALGFNTPQLKYTIDQYFSTQLINDKDYWALNRPTLEIDKDNFGIPGHRFPLWGLETDFASTDWDFKPWDDIFHLCQEKVPDGITVPELNTTIDINTVGDEILVFDSIPLVYYGNNIPADVPSFSDHTTNKFITHTVITTAPRGHEAIELDQTTYAEDLATTPPDTICIPSEIGNIFDSANNAS